MQRPTNETVTAKKIPILMGEPAREVDWRILYRELDAPQRERFSCLVRVKDALDRSDEFAGQKALTEWENLPGRHLFPIVIITNADGSVAETTFSKASLEAQRATLVKIVNEETRKVRVMLFNKDGRLTPAMFCPDVNSALHVRVVLGGETHVCARCAALFEPFRSDQIYCGKKCENAQRAARYRANLRRKKR